MVAMKRPASLFPIIRKIWLMMVSVCFWMKTLVKTSLDNYVLPGTATGTEILWLYMIQWRRDLAALFFSSCYLLHTPHELPKLASMLFEREECLD